MAIPAKPALMHATVYDNISKDDVPDALKEQVISLCGTCDIEAGPDVTAVESVFNEFSGANRHTGNPIFLPPDETVGHIKLLDSTASHLSRLLSLDRDRIEELFRWLAGEGGPSQSEEAEQWFGDLVARLDSSGNALVISGPVCWLFRDDATADAQTLFDNSPECLPCRLGLPTVLEQMPPYPHGLAFLGMSVKGARVNNARNATVFHGDYVSIRDIWLPGGFTQPIELGPEHCVAMGGVREFVANPPQYAEIDPRIRILTT